MWRGVPGADERLEDDVDFRGMGTSLGRLARPAATVANRVQGMMAFTCLSGELFGPRKKCQLWEGVRMVERLGAK